MKLERCPYAYRARLAGVTRTDAAIWIYLMEEAGEHRCAACKAPWGLRVLSPLEIWCIQCGSIGDISRDDQGHLVMRLKRPFTV